MEKFLNFVKPKKEMRGAGIVTALMIPIIIHFFAVGPEDTLWMRITNIVTNAIILFVGSAIGAIVAGLILYGGYRLCLWLMRDKEEPVPEVGTMMLAAFPVIFCVIYVMIMLQK